jgi:hypothetical protein
MAQSLETGKAEKATAVSIVPMQWQALTLGDLRRDGIARTPLTFPVDAVRDYLSETEVYNAHVAAKATARDRFGNVYVRQQWPMFCHSMQDIVTAPHILEASLSLYPLVRDYFQEAPLLYSMNAFWTQPAPNAPKYADTHWWHIDGDDRQQLVVFFMGTDVPTKDDGAHLYQRGSHKHYPNPTKENLGYDWEHPPESVVEVVTGKAGQVFLTDPRGMHMAPRPASRPRGLFWARWGVSDPPVSYGWDKLAPVPRSLIGSRFPGDPVLQRAIHLVVQ